MTVHDDLRILGHCVTNSESVCVLSVSSTVKYYMCTQTYKLHILYEQHYSNIQLCGQGVSV